MMEYSNWGIACESGGFRCVFVHGVLAALESHGVRAAAYAAASASVLPAAMAAVGRARAPGMQYWREAIAVRMADGNGMSEMVCAGIDKYAPLVEAHLFADDAPRFIIAASEVIDPVVAEQTQGPLASRVGREQLLRMARGDEEWAAGALRPVMFDTHPTHGPQLSTSNFRDVAYASTRMLHAWRVSAAVEGRPYIDASYTVGFPAHELLDRGFARVLAIATGNGTAYRNLYRSNTLVSTGAHSAIDVISPDVDLKVFGVDFTTATEEGLELAYRHGSDLGERWLANSS